MPIVDSAANPVVVVGAGIAGLSAAWELYRRGRRNVLVLETSGRAGGVVQTEHEAGFLFELGPDSFLTRKTAVAELCSELGIGADVTGCTMPLGRTQILRRGALHPLPEGWQMLAPGRIRPALRTPLLSPVTKMRIAWRWLRAAAPASGEESVAQFLERNFGPEMVSAIAEPLLAGVYGGSPDELSLPALLPHLPRMEKSGRPLVRELRRQARAAAGSVPGQPPFSSLRAGMGSLVEALVGQLPSGWLQYHSAVASIEPESGADRGWRLQLADGRRQPAAAVIVAAPAWAAAPMLHGLDAKLAATLAAIPYAPALTVNLAFEDRFPLPPGSGFLVPRTEGLAMMACTFAHQKFPERARPGHALLRMFFRGDPGVTQPEGEEAIVGTACRELAQVLGAAPAPRVVRIANWERALAQYTVGHEGRLAAIADRLRQQPGLQLAGGAYRGIGVPDCIASGRAAAAEVCGAA